MFFGAAILVLLGITATATIVACFLLGSFGGAFTALRSEQRLDLDASRRRMDALSNDVQALGEKVEKTAAVSSEMNRLLVGAREERRRSRPDT